MRYLGAACETCNNTWMSRSEQRVRPLLTPPIQNRPVLWTSEDDKTAVAAWATKTALMLDRSVVPSRRTVPDKEFVHLFLDLIHGRNRALHRHRIR